MAGSLPWLATQGGELGPHVSYVYCLFKIKHFVTYCKKNSFGQKWIKSFDDKACSVKMAG